MHLKVQVKKGAFDTRPCKKVVAEIVKGDL